MDTPGVVDLSSWCELCNMKIAVGVSSDGVPACMSCMTDVLESFKRPNRQERRRMRRVTRRNNDGSPKR